MAFFAKKELRLFGVAERIKEGFVEVLPSQVMSHGFVDGVDTVVVIVDAAGNDFGLGNFIGPVNADDLFDKIDLTLQILAVGWDGDFPKDAAIALLMNGNAKSEGFEDGLHFSVADIESNEVSDTFWVKLDLRNCGGLCALFDQIAAAPAGVCYSLQLSALEILEEKVVDLLLTLLQAEA